jgi:hypothetical protein
MWFLWVVSAVIVLSWFGGAPISVISAGIAALPIAIIGTKHLIKEEKQKAAVQEEEQRWRKNLERKAEEERVLGQARNEPVIKLMQEQANNLIRQQEAGMHVERELMAMREKMVALENSEFSSIIDKINKHL